MYNKPLTNYFSCSGTSVGCTGDICADAGKKSKFLVIVVKQVLKFTDHCKLSASPAHNVNGILRVGEREKLLQEKNIVVWFLEGRHFDHSSGEFPKLVQQKDNLFLLGGDVHPDGFDPYASADSDKTLTWAIQVFFILRVAMFTYSNLQSIRTWQFVHTKVRQLLTRHCQIGYSWSKYSNIHIYCGTCAKSDSCYNVWLTQWCAACFFILRDQKCILCKVLHSVQYQCTPV